MATAYLFTGAVDPIAELLGQWSSNLNLASVLFRVAMTFLLSAFIGCERANKRHSAGLRTFIIVSLASALAMLLDEYMITSFGMGFPIVSAAAVVGISILSGNSILFSSKSQVKGLTTSVALWMCGMLGLLLGAGFYTASLAGFAALACCLWLLPAAEIDLKNRSNHFEIHLELNSRSSLQDFVTTLRRLGLKIDDIEANPAYLNSGLSVYSISLTITGAELKKYKKHSEIIEALSTLEYVNYIEEIK